MSTINIIISRIVLCIHSIYTFAVQSFAYPWMVNHANLPIPTIAIIGISCEFIGHVVITLPGWVWLFVANAFIGTGFCLAAPTAVTILSVGIM